MLTTTLLLEHDPPEHPVSLQVLQHPQMLQRFVLLLSLSGPERQVRFDDEACSVLGFLDQARTNDHRDVLSRLKKRAPVSISVHHGLHALHVACFNTGLERLCKAADGGLEFRGPLLCYRSERGNLVGGPGFVEEGRGSGKKARFEELEGACFDGGGFLVQRGVLSFRRNVVFGPLHNASRVVNGGFVWYGGDRVDPGSRGGGAAGYGRALCSAAPGENGNHEQKYDHNVLHEPPPSVRGV